MNPDRIDAKRYRFCKQHGFPQFSEACSTPYAEVPAFWFLRANGVLFKADTFDECVDKARVRQGS